VAAPERTAAPAPTEDELRDAVERALRERLGAAIAVTRLRRHRGEHSSSYATELIVADLADREPVRLFLKDFGIAAWQKDLMPERRLREVRVYRDLLDGADVGTPAFVGAVWDEDRGRHWLLLEHVDGPQVKWCEFAEWQRAAGWLATLHRRFSSANAELARADFLVRHDATFFLDAAEQARRVVAACAPRLRERLDVALRDYGALAEQMAAQPKTLVHGGFRPQNIIRGTRSGDPRICPVDWEEAAHGSHLYDFAYLADGFEGAPLDALWRAYHRQAIQECIELPARSAAATLVCAFNVHKNLGTLAKAVDRSFPPTAVEKLVAMVERSARGAHA
jgi:aminoglycoside phosphotransferase (APT) family kinase protein